MGKQRFLAALFVAALSTGLSGCFYTYRTATVLVRDEVTGQPLPNVEVAARYFTKCDPFSPIPSSGTTGTDGKSTLRIASYFNGKELHATCASDEIGRYIKDDEVEKLPYWWPWMLLWSPASERPDFILDIPVKRAPIK